MHYKSTYNSPIGKLFIVFDDKQSLVGLWIEGQKYFASNIKIDEIEEIKDCDFEKNCNFEILSKTKSWLDRYFKGEKPKIEELSLMPFGNEFRQSVWEILRKIPYGEVITYGEIADIIARKQGKSKMSAQAVGNAVGHNPISIIIPCHRVIGKNGSLTGYAAGIDKKIKLLELEGAKIQL